MLALGCDHGGYELKQEIKRYLDNHDISYLDLGTNSIASTDYPKYAKMVCQAILNGVCDKGILICGTGIVLALGARVTGAGLAVKIVETFLETPFSGDERHLNRIRQIEE